MFNGLLLPLDGRLEVAQLVMHASERVEDAPVGVVGQLGSTRGSFQRYLQIFSRWLGTDRRVPGELVEQLGLIPASLDQFTAES